MNVKEAIEKRKSIRKYQAKNVPANLINELIEAARLAPSGGNTQPARYFIIQDEKTKKELKENKVFGQTFVYQAPVIIVCCGSLEIYNQKKLDPDFDYPFDIQMARDISIAAQNLVLRATELGLGTCYIGWLHKDRMKKVLGLSKDYVVPFAITVGYPAEEPRPTPRKKIDEIVLNR